ncbi:MAG: hypothetical protein ACRBM6_33305 [Geminicoccales bacterium]
MHRLAIITAISMALCSAAEAFQVEAESLSLDSQYVVETNAKMSGGKVIKVEGPNGTSGTATYTFNASHGRYDLRLTALNESDGASPIEVKVNNQLIGQVVLDGTDWHSNVLVAENILLSQGDTVDVIGTRNAGELARIDFIAFIPVSDESDHPTAPIDDGPITELAPLAEACHLPDDPYQVCADNSCAPSEQTVVVNANRNAIQQGVNALKDKDRNMKRVLVIKGPGVVNVKNSPIDLSVPGGRADAPIWIKAEPPGSVVFNQFETVRNDWHSEGGDVFSRPWAKRPIYVLHQGEALQHHGSFDNEGIGLKHGTWKAKPGICSGITRRNAGYGFAHQDGRLYVKLPGAANPTGENVEIGPEKNKNRASIKITNAPHMILDGFVIKGNGWKGINANAASHHLTIRNTVWEFARYGVTLPDNSTVEWSEYSNRNWRKVANDVIANNTDDAKPSYQYCLVKGQQDIDYAAYESGLLLSSHRAGFENAEIRYNYIHDVVDGMGLGKLEDSSAHHNVFEYNWDDHVELEGGQAGDDHGRNIKLHHNLMRNSATIAVSHQDTKLKGPHYVYRNVIIDDDSRWATKNGMLKLLQTKTGNYRHYHNLYWKIRPHKGGQSGLWLGNSSGDDGDPKARLDLLNNLIIFEDADSKNPSRLGFTGNLNAEHNLVVNGNSHQQYEGGNGRTISDHSSIDFADAHHRDFTPGANSLARSIGKASVIPSSWPGRKSNVAGPFPEEGETSGIDWPRPACRVYTTRLPDGW